MKNEAALQTYCNNVLRRLGWLFYHKEKGRRVSKSHSAGFPDLVIFRRGRAFFIELKTPEGVLSPAQKFWREDSERNGFLYMVVRTEAEFLIALDEIIRILGAR